jgi:uncharacterized protein YodC (DUF2158 family)
MRRARDHGAQLMAEQKFPNGARVGLKSGGPNMTVVDYDTYGLGANTKSYLCKWFDTKGELKEATFSYRIEIPA